MDVIDENAFDEAEPLPEKEHKPVGGMHELSEEDFDRVLKSMNNPVESQKELAVMIKVYLDQKISSELREKGILSDHTRRWADLYNQVLEKIHKQLYGDRSVNINLHKVNVTHSAINQKIREAAKNYEN